MYKGKKILGITGKTCSGKSYLLRTIRTRTNYHCIDLDSIPIYISKTKRYKILQEQGVEKLEEITMPLILKKFFREVENSPKKVIVVEGVKIKKYLGSILDFCIETSLPKRNRRNLSKCKGWSEEKFELIDSLLK